MARRMGLTGVLVLCLSTAVAAIGLIPAPMLAPHRHAFELRSHPGELLFNRNHHQPAFSLVAKGKKEESCPLNPVQKAVNAVGDFFCIKNLPKLVDTALAGFGLFGTLALMSVLEPALGIKLFAAPMMASGIIFFAPGEPPNPFGFLVGTAGSATVAAGALAVVSARALPAAVGAGAAAGALLMWFKATGAIFPPSAVLSLLMAQAVATGLAASTFSGWSSSLSYVAFPWLSGHAVLWASAYAVGQVRSAARYEFGKQQFKSLGTLSSASIKETFKKFDTSKDGSLDAVELKVALRVVVGADLSVAECERLIGAADANGSGSVDLKEFEAIIRNGF